MKLAHIEAFYSVIQAGSISQAAREMHLTQPALSLQIRDLEEFFRVQLLERTNKGVRPTPAGELVYYYGQKLMSIKETLCGEIIKLQNGLNRQLLLGASTVVGGYAIPCSIYCFKETYPDADIKLTIANSKKILEMLNEGSLDAAVIEGPMPQPLGCMTDEIVARTIGLDDLIVIAPPGVLSDNKDIISIDELRELPMIVREPGSGIRASMEKALDELGVSFNQMNVIMELNSIEAIKAFVAAGKGFSILSYLAVRKELYYGTLKSLQIDGLSGKHIFTLLHPRRAFLSPLEKEFITFMKSDGRSFC